MRRPTGPPRIGRLDKRRIDPLDRINDRLLYLLRKKSSFHLAASSPRKEEAFLESTIVGDEGRPNITLL